MNVSSRSLKTVRPVLSDRCLSCPDCLFCLSVTLVYCGQMVGWIKLPLGTEIGLGLGPRPHCVRWGPSSLHPDPPRKGHSSPHFSAHVYCGQTAGWIKIPLGTDLGLGPDGIVLDGDPVPPPTERALQPFPHALFGHKIPTLQDNGSVA